MDKKQGNSWTKGLFESVPAGSDTSASAGTGHSTKGDRIGGSGAFWAARLFEGKTAEQASAATMRIIRNGIPFRDLALADLKPETVIGRHPKADIQLEAQRMGMFHACLWRFDDEIYIENLDPQSDTLLNQKRLIPKHPIQLRDGALVDLPGGYRLLFRLPDWPAAEEGEAGQEEVTEIPDFFYTPKAEPPPPCPLLSNLIEARDSLEFWTEGVTTLKVADIIEETADVKTFRLVGTKPLLFAYKPGQFVTFILTIEGREVQRSYSMSSSPSRPHTLDVTVKRVPGGLVSNWLCDQVKLGDVLKMRGPSGRFTCFEYPSDKLLFIAAGSGVTPIMSMCRWIVDTAAGVDVKLLASFRSPPDIMFRRELEWMSARHSGIQVALTVTSNWHGTECWTGFTGRVGQSMINLVAPDFRDRHIFMCGPEPFMDRLKDILRDLDFDLARLHSESFAGGRVAQGVERSASSLKLTGPLHKVTFAKSGLTVETDEHITLLELAEAHGIEIAYSCRAGSCGECEVKCRGDVEHTKESNIDAPTRAAGFVYSCTCVAKGDLELEA